MRTQLYREVRPPFGLLSHSGRVFVFYSIAVLLTGIAALLFADLLWRFGWSASGTLLLVLFSILFLLVAIGAVHSLYGFVLRRQGGGRRITQLGDYQNCTLEGTHSALIFPIFNEDVSAVYARLRATYESLVVAGQVTCFDFFILSDSTDPDRWLEEECRWFELTHRLDALGRIFYHRRRNHEGGKSGNVRNFLRNWGRSYRYFVIFDADSLMAGSTLVDLVKLMECHPAVGLIQTPPVLVNARSLFGRFQQFAVRLYGPLFAAGLNFWTQDGSTYWGHNAIIRTKPFMDLCDLPRLPGRKPFGGKILSHDFVEAALLGKENWQVWLAWDLPGSYEEGPGSSMASAQRDRRWCQGNLQHALLLFARGLRGTSRLQFLFGIFSYLAGPMWLLFLLIASSGAWYRKETGLSEIVVSGFTPFIHLSSRGHGLAVFGLVLGMCLLPKALALLELVLDSERQREFGGLARAVGSVVLETVFSTLHAPIQMMFHTQFVVATLLGYAIRWDPTQREIGATTWQAALCCHWGHTLLGIVWGTGMWWIDPRVFLWFVPVAAALALSVPFAVLSSSESLGLALQRRRWLLTPEERGPPPELVRFNIFNHLAPAVRTRTKDSGLKDVILDPCMNAIHVSLLVEQTKHPDESNSSGPLPEDSAKWFAVEERLLSGGPDSLTELEKEAVLEDPASLGRLHREVWIRAEEALAECWRAGFEVYTREHFESG